MVSPEAIFEDEQAVRAALGLDRSYPVQFVAFISHAVRGDFGASLRAARPVMEIIRERVPNSLRLSAAAMGVTLLFSVPMGVIAAVRKRRSR